MSSYGELPEKIVLNMDVEGSPENVKTVTRLELYNILKGFKGKNMDEKFTLMEDRLAELTSCPTEDRDVLSRSLRYFKTSFKQKWTTAHNTHERFLKNNEEWLRVPLKLPLWSHRPGRPVKEFHELSERSKRRRTEELRAQIPAEELIFAASVSQGTSGNADASKIIKELTLTPTRAKKFRRIVSSKKDLVDLKYTTQEALSLFVEGNFTRSQWNLIQGGHKNIYPCYSLLQKAKKECYPDDEKITVTETSFNVELQALLNHTALRLIQYLKNVVDTLTDTEKQNLLMISKWGCDGSHQTPFKQKFENATDDDSNIFVSSIVPVRLVVSLDGKTTTTTIWQNPVPSSVRFCRPIRARFIHETKDVTKEEIEYIENQAKNLKETEDSEISVKISHNTLLTMVDGKVCNSATDTASTMRCYICGQTSKDFNKLKKGAVKKEALKFGLSVLHARIRFFETLLHLAYKLPLKKWQARTPEEKKIVKETKEKLQKSFREEMGLLVDVPKAGFGNSNDGNTSRRFFQNAECSSRITGINLELINKFKVILEVISSGHEVDHQKFDDYAQDTAKLYVELYGWYPMSPTVHKILMHGAQVMADAILPIGQLSEEAAEARNKHIRKYRVDFARKFSRTECNRDILNRLLLTSDPLISSSGPKKKKKILPFSAEAKTILIAATPNLNRSDDNTIEDIDDDEEDSDVNSESEDTNAE